MPRRSSKFELQILDEIPERPLRPGHFDLFPQRCSLQGPPCPPFCRNEQRAIYLSNSDVSPALAETPVGSVKVGVAYRPARSRLQSVVANRSETAQLIQNSIEVSFDDQHYFDFTRSSKASARVSQVDMPPKHC